MVRPLVPLAALAALACGRELTAPGAPAEATLAVGGVFSCVIGAEGAVACWGLNAWGQLGAATGEHCGTEPCARRPVPTAPALRFRMLSASPASSVWAGHVCGVTSEGAAFCWGVDKTQLGRERPGTEFCVAQNGAVGQLCSREPVRVALPGDVAAVASGDFHSCGLDAGGAAWCWGSDSNGQLGSNDAEVCGEFALPCSLAPVHVSSDVRFRAVTAGSIHACALAEAGEAWCWGNNDDRQLGHEAAVGRQVPSVAAGGRRFAQISAGRRHTCGLVPGGEVYCWGDNSGGQLGAGLSVGVTTDVRVKTAARFVAISAGWSHTCGLAADGAAYCWGSNEFGQLGVAPPPDESCAAGACSTVPLRVSSDRRFIAIGAGGAHTCALVADGPVYCWGDNTFGQLGNGGDAASARPVPVAAPAGRS